MQHFKAFTSSFTAAARDFARDISSATSDSASSGKQYSVNGKTFVEEKLLSEGGFGFVHLVRDLSSGAKFVVKKILCMDKENYDMAMREVEVFEKLPTHANLVRYYGHTVSKESRNREVIIVLEFCPGGHLYDLMKQYPDGVPVPKVIKALLDVSRGLVALHSMSPPVQHRDLKLENVLMSASGNYVLLDFGSWSSDSPDLSQLTREELMRFGDSVERYTTLMYRPPEMADLYKGFKVSTKVDIWMLGCILFTLINNKHPFQDASTLAIVNCKFSHDAELCKKRPWKLIELCDWLLAQNPTDRPDANLLVSILETWDDQSRPLLNLPQSVIDRIEKDSKFLGIGKQSKKKSGKSTDHLGGWGGTPVDSSSNPPPTNPEWKADFGDLLDIQTEKVNIEQPRRSSAPSIELPNLLD